MRIITQAGQVNPACLILLCDTMSPRDDVDRKARLLRDNVLIGAVTQTSGCNYRDVDVLFPDDDARTAGCLDTVHRS